MRKFARLVQAPRGTVLLVVPPPLQCIAHNLACSAHARPFVSERAIWVRFQRADRYIGSALAHLGPVPTAVPVLCALVSRKRNTSNACVQLF